MTSADPLGTVDRCQPVFLSGVYRSGTTLLTQIVGAHPGLAITYDSVKFPRFCLGKYDPIDEKANWKRLVRDTHLRLAKRWEMQLDTEAVCAALDAVAEVTYAEVYHAIMEELLAPPDGRWGEKVAVSWTFIPQFLEMFPKGRAIHVFRDPRDATASFKHMTYEPGYAFLDCAFNCLHAMTSLAAYRQRFGADRVMWVRMEDLADYPEREARRMAEFMGLPYDPAMLDPACYRDKAGRPWKNNSEYDPEMKGISRDYTRWPKLLTPAEVAFVELVCLPQMPAFGYDLSGDVPGREEWAQVRTFAEDPVLAPRFAHWLTTGEGTESYPSDPSRPEMKVLAEALAELGLGDQVPF